MKFSHLLIAFSCVSLLVACSSINAVHPANNQIHNTDQNVQPLQKCNPG